MPPTGPAARPLRAALLAAAGCSGDEEAAPVEERPVEATYGFGLDAPLSGDHGLAVREFQGLERRSPYSTWAVRAQLMVPYALYLQNEYGEAIQAAERFIQLHPGNKDIPYARHLVALCHYEQIPDAKRDQSATAQARTALEGVVSRHPDTRYARDAAVKLDLVDEHLAGKEMDMGRTYQLLRQCPAAVIRFGNVVRDHPRTAHVPEALARLVETHLALGVEGEVRAMAAVLGHSYPQTQCCDYACGLPEGAGPRPKRSFLGVFLESFRRRVNR